MQMHTKIFRPSCITQTTAQTNMLEVVVVAIAVMEVVEVVSKEANLLAHLLSIRLGGPMLSMTPSSIDLILR